MFTKCGEYFGAMADSVDLSVARSSREACECQPYPHTRTHTPPHTHTHTHPAIVLLPLCCVNTPFVAFPVDSCPAVRRAVTLKFEMQMWCRWYSVYSVSVPEPVPSRVPRAVALKKYSTFGSQNNQNILYVAFSYTLLTPDSKAHELCAKNAAHVVIVRQPWLVPARGPCPSTCRSC